MSMRVTIRGADTDSLHNALGSVVDIDDEAADIVVAADEAALSAAAARGERRPMLPVGFGAPWSPSTGELADLCGLLTDRQLPTVDVAPLVVSVGETQSTAVFDTTLITSEPARISEYGVSVAGRRHAAFRADGVVVASPLGSHGYARAAGGPQLGFGTGLAVVPIAPFATIADTWVVSPPLSVSVERDDSVTVLADSDQLTTGRSELTVEIETGEPLSLIDPRRLGGWP